MGPYTFKNPKRAASAADNVREPLLEGIRGVGTLLWWASQHEEFGASRYSRAAIGEVGLLLELLGELAESTSIIGINAAATHAESANA